MHRAPHPAAGTATPPLTLCPTPSALTPPLAAAAAAAAVPMGHTAAVGSRRVVASVTPVVSQAVQAVDLGPPPWGRGRGRAQARPVTAVPTHRGGTVCCSPCNVGLWWVVPRRAGGWQQGARALHHRQAQGQLRPARQVVTAPMVVLVVVVVVVVVPP